MIFGFVEDGTVEVYDDVASAKGQWTAPDVDSEVVVFFTEDGVWLEPRRTKGQFELEPNPHPPPGIDTFEIAMGDAVSLKANRHFHSLHDIRRHVRARQDAGK